MQGKELPIQLTVLDPDSPSVNKITVHVTDPLQLFQVRDPVIFHGVNGDHMLVNTGKKEVLIYTYLKCISIFECINNFSLFPIALVPKAKFHFPDFSYNVSVIFNDTSLVNKNKVNMRLM